MKVYHTLTDKDNPDHIEERSPFKCKRENAWLGHGYYFWDTLIDNAHWWGKTHCGGNYVVVEHTCDPYHDEKCFDLHGNMEHIGLFNKTIDSMKSRGVYDECTTVAAVIDFLKRTTDFGTRYEAIRIYGVNSKSSKNTTFVIFEKHKDYYLERTPAVQLCLFRKNSLNLSAGKIAYPLDYVSD